MNFLVILEATTGQMSWQAQVISGIFALIGMVITGFLVPWLKQKASLVKDDNARKALEMAISLAEGTIGGIVQSISQTLVKEYVKNGDWNETTKKIVLQEAINRVKLALTSEQADAIVAQTQMTLEQWITNKIEAYIHEVNPNKDITA